MFKPRRTAPADLAFHHDTGSTVGQIIWSGVWGNSPGHAMRTVEYYAIVYVLEGCCLYEDQNGLKRKLVPGDLMMQWPGFRQQYLPEPGGPWMEQYVTFRGPVFDQLAAAGQLHTPQPVHHLEPIARWTGQMAAVIGGVMHPEPDESLAQVGRLLELLADIRLAVLVGSPGREDHVWLREARALLERCELGERPDLRQVADELGMSYANFRKKFTALAGIAPAGFYRAVLIRRSVEMMSRARLTNKELAVACGFCDEYHFSRQFKQVMGLSPSEYRKRTIAI